MVLRARDAGVDADEDETGVQPVDTDLGWAIK